MKAGKISAEKLQELVLSQLGSSRPDVLLGAAVGEDSSVIDFGDEVCVISTDPITGAGRGLGTLAVHVSCNDVAANGAAPVGVQVALLLPEKTSDEDIRLLMMEIDTACRDLGIAVLGGHTEIISKVSEPIVVTTAIGRVKKTKYVTSSGARPGDELIVTKGAGLEGTAIIAADFAHLLRGRVSNGTLARARGFLKHVSVVREALLASAEGVSAMHDITEGGFYGALSEVATASGVGFDVYAEKVPVLPETAEICGVLHLDPLGLISSGSLLIAAPEGERIVETLKSSGIAASVVGRVTEKGRRIWRGNQWEPFPTPKDDELWRFYRYANPESFNAGSDETDGS